MKIKFVLYALIGVLLLGCSTPKDVTKNEKRCFSGIYPHLAYYNNEGECGTGAVVPWANRLWVITYGPHCPAGSSDKLYEISPDLEQIVRPESIGGTPANRMIHKETNQLFIGPYAIDANANVRTIPYSVAYGRYTGCARHLKDPENKLYIATMEEGFYEVDVHTLDVKTLYTDGNLIKKEGKMDQYGPLLPGAHGKGLYSGQGVMVFSNNGEANHAALEKFDVESGALAEWDGKDWKIIRRNQFVEVTGPGGIYGNPNPETDPIWATGWDFKSVLLGVRYNGGWTFYRLPKVSHSYDGAHGWNTEWPRIRNVGTEDKPDYLMTMHGMFWRFPGTFTPDNSAGIRPRSSYLKVIGDFARWNGKLVFGCDDSAQKEFLNKRSVKGNIEGPGQSNSNLWFTSLDKPDHIGPTSANGAVWISENINANEYSEPFLFAGWEKRISWIKNEYTQDVKFTFEVDELGNNNWKEIENVEVKANASANISFASSEKGEWIRVKADKATKATVHFSYTANDDRSTEADKIFTGLSSVNDKNSKGGLLYGLGDNRRAMGMLAIDFEGETASETGYYELDGDMNLVKKDDEETASFIRKKFAVPENVITIEESSVLVVDDKGRRWRLPLGDNKYTDLTNAALLRICREVATERDLFNCHGTFYELPAENADGFAKIRPIASHKLRIHDYASYRGLLILTGLQKDAKNDDHIITSDDGKASLWAGTIDDLWKLGKPTGVGGPWKNTSVKANEASDPYLIGFYDKKHLTLSHNSKEDVIFTIEVEPIGHGPWMIYKEISVAAGETFDFDFPDGFQARWIRFVSNIDCEATALLEYK